MKKKAPKKSMVKEMSSHIKDVEKGYKKVSGEDKKILKQLKSKGC